MMPTGDLPIVPEPRKRRYACASTNSLMRPFKRNRFPGSRFLLDTSFGVSVPARFVNQKYRFVGMFSGFRCYPCETCRVILLKRSRSPGSRFLLDTSYGVSVPVWCVNRKYRFVGMLSGDRCCPCERCGSRVGMGHQKDATIVRRSLHRLRKNSRCVRACARARVGVYVYVCMCMFVCIYVVVPFILGSSLEPLAMYGSAYKMKRGVLLVYVVVPFFLGASLYICRSSCF